MHRLKYKYILSLLFLLFISVRGYAQDISVTEFYLDEKDLTANGRHAVEDQNGDKCALIRVQTTQKGFSFDVGSAGITKVEDDHVGEVWLWVPFGIRHISIRHQQLRSLPNRVREGQRDRYIGSLSYAYKKTTRSFEHR